MSHCKIPWESDGWFLAEVNLALVTLVSLSFLVEMRVSLQAEAGPGQIRATTTSDQHMPLTSTLAEWLVPVTSLALGLGCSEMGF